MPYPAMNAEQVMIINLIYHSAFQNPGLPSPPQTLRFGYHAHITISSISIGPKSINEVNDSYELILAFPRGTASSQGRHRRSGDGLRIVALQQLRGINGLVVRDHGDVTILSRTATVHPREGLKHGDREVTGVIILRTLLRSL